MRRDARDLRAGKKGTDVKRRRFLYRGLQSAAGACAAAWVRAASEHTTIAAPPDASEDRSAADAGVAAATGPLKPHPANPRYFANGEGRAVLLVGSHTWNNLVDMGRDEPPVAFDFERYLRFLRRYGHNFIRLWTWDCTIWNTRANGRWGKDYVHRVAPHPWRRTGPGKALDGKPRFDLTQFDPEYFRRLRDRVARARKLGIYVSVMLFEGWALFHANTRRGVPAGWAWKSHPFHPANNVNGIDAGVPGDPLRGRPHSLANPRVNELQRRYIHRVVDTVNAFDNVLYEVINEGGEKEWDWWVVRTVHEYERQKPRQHPVGLTAHGAERLESMLASPCDWVSPGSRDGFRDHPPRGTIERRACSTPTTCGASAATGSGSGEAFCAGTIRCSWTRTTAVCWEKPSTRSGSRFGWPWGTFGRSRSGSIWHAWCRRTAWHRAVIAWPIRGVATWYWRKPGARCGST